ncbi:MAG: hypothetical protein DCC52_10880 [Chloroflexi bacterium]|nr:MAG: hypothetical protein DCC52_10880 [Chloroflexota bacterium]
MKYIFVIAAALLFLAVLFGSFSQAQADPQPRYLPNESATPTATATATTDPCTVAPPKPQLVAPKRGATTNSTTMTFKWRKSECNRRYRVEVKRGSPDGPKVWTRGNKKNQLTATGLARGYTYYWRVRACTTLDLCTWSKYWSFKINSVNPSPTKTPTPVPGQPTATPVPGGNPPPQIVNYSGSAAYLNDKSDELWRSDCKLDEKKWRDYLVGSTIYNIALWYKPNEQVKYERVLLDLGQLVETKMITANSSGYVSFNVNTASWTPDYHYHLIFTGQSSGAKHCGHFDLIGGSAPSEGHGHELDHSPAAVERAYRQAGLDLPK